MMIRPVEVLSGDKPTWAFPVRTSLHGVGHTTPSRPIPPRLNPELVFPINHDPTPAQHSLDPSPPPSRSPPRRKPFSPDYKPSPPHS